MAHTRDQAATARLSGARIQREADRLLRNGQITPTEHARFTSIAHGAW